MSVGEREHARSSKSHLCVCVCTCVYTYTGVWRDREGNSVVECSSDLFEALSLSPDIYQRQTNPQKKMTDKSNKKQLCGFNIFSFPGYISIRSQNVEDIKLNPSQSH